MSTELRIIFSGPMLAAIRAGQKSQTRRIFRIALDARAGAWADTVSLAKDGMPVAWWGNGITPNPYATGYRLRGITGDTLAIAEPCWLWGRWRVLERNKRKSVILNQQVRYEAPAKEELAPRDGSREGWVIRQGRYAPNWTVRLRLRVTNWRIERLQEISEADAQAEGVADREAFRRLWEDLNAGREYCDWRSNPWVIVREFARESQ